jgi:hypothetical protein
VSAVSAAGSTLVQDGGRRATGGRTPVQATIVADNDMALDTILAICADTNVRAAVVPEVADGRSADGSGSLQLPLLCFKTVRERPPRPPASAASGEG